MIVLAGMCVSLFLALSLLSGCGGTGGEPEGYGDQDNTRDKPIE